MRFFFSLVLVVLVISSGVGVVMYSSAEQGAMNVDIARYVAAMERLPQTREVLAKLESIQWPWESSPAEASAPAKALPAQVAATQPPPVTVLPGRPIGDWTLNCGVNPQTARKQCTIAQQLTDQKSKSVVFAWLIGNDGNGNLVAIWQTPTGVMVNHGVLIDIGANKPADVPFTSCIAGRCEAVASLDADFVSALARATSATATIQAVSGEDMTFRLSVNGLAEAIDAVKAPTAS
ncbi:MAG TPA: invasion associated locus B family protein [Bauldia sp.]|nr:invasion associated locus B family protein [Bauldia sp.]